MFDFGDDVDGDKLSNSTLSPVCAGGRQSRNFMNINEDCFVKVTVGCAASNRAPNMTDGVGDVSLQQLQLLSKQTPKLHRRLPLYRNDVSDWIITWLINIHIRCRRFVAVLSTVESQQNGDRSSTKSKVDFVADLSPFCRICRQCVPALSIPL